MTNQYQLGSNVAPVLDAVDKVAGSPWTQGLGPLGILRGTDFGDSGAYNAANNRSADFAADIFETYGLRVASLTG